MQTFEFMLVVDKNKTRLGLQRIGNTMIIVIQIKRVAQIEILRFVVHNQNKKNS